MRKELKLIALIEQYLRNELDEADRVAFEQRLQTNEELKQEVELQRDLMLGLQRLGLTTEIQQAYKKYKGGTGGSNGWKFGLGTVVVIVAALAALYLNTELSIPFLSEQSSTDQAAPQLASQYFTINNSETNILETEKGIVLAIDADAFVDANGHTVKGKVQIEMKEALDGLTIMKSGLSTRSGKDWLETGGMFYISATKDGQELKIADGKEVIVEVPTDKQQPGMMLYDGVVEADGNVDWQDPKPLRNYLVPVDIHSLNFYPPGYLDTLTAWGLDASNKQFTDSLFYSFYCNVMPEVRDSLDIIIDSAYIGPFDAYNGSDVNVTFAVETDTVVTEVLLAQGDAVDHDTEVVVCNCIEPSSIRAIWDDKFQGSVVATREFEERLKYLYLMDNDAIEFFEAYVMLGSSPMYTLDSILAHLDGFKLQEKFQEFYARRDGSVPIDNNLVKELGAYYSQKRKAYQQAVIETRRKWMQEQGELNRKAQELGSQDEARKREAFNKELDMNMKEAYGQLGIELFVSNGSIVATEYIDQGRVNIPPQARYQVVINATGWKNIDRATFEATTNRTTLDFTAKDGKKAKIEYKPLEVEVVGAEHYDRLYVYLLTPELSSFIRMKGEGNIYKESLNELVTYHVACVAYKGDDMYLSVEKNVMPIAPNISTTPRPADEEALNRNLGKLYKATGVDLLKDLDYMQFKVMDQKRRERNLKDLEFRSELYPVVFPCNDRVQASSYERGRKLFTFLCSACHKVDAKLIGPSLRDVTARWEQAGSYQGVTGKEWLIRFIRNWQDPVNEGYPYAENIQNYDPSAMSTFPTATDKNINDILEYIEKAPSNGRRL